MKMNHSIVSRFLQIVERVTAGQERITADEKNQCVVPCPDQAVGLMERLIDIECFDRLSVECVPKRRRGVLLILESPHRDEYYTDRLGERKSRGPASGCTGCQIRRHLIEVIRAIDPVNDYREWMLFLVNAVKFQCSLGRNINGKAHAKNKKIKESIALQCLQDDLLVQDFKDRVARVMRGRQCLIINACTKVLRNAVSEVLMTIHKEAFAVCDHPSSWWRPEITVEYGGNVKKLRLRRDEGLCCS